VLFAVALIAPAASAQTAADFTFAFHGYAVGSLYYQDAQLVPSNGQQVWFPTSQATNHNSLFGGDVRTSRFNFSAAGPKVLGGATPRGLVEFDFSNQAGPGGFGDVSVLPRLRLLFAEMNWGNTAIRFGQDHNLVLGGTPWTPVFIPASVGHVGYPLSFQAGEIGFRAPNAAVFQRVPLADGAAVEMGIMVVRSEWSAPQDILATTAGAGSPNPTPAIPEVAVPLTSAGESSGMPAVEGLLQYSSKIFRIYVSGHYGQVHRAGFGINETAAASDLTVAAGQAHARVSLGPVTVLAGGFAGENTAPFVGNLVQFQANTRGTVHEMGGWAQLGFNFTPEISIWGFGGTSQPNQAEARAAALTRLQNTVTSGMLRYQEKGLAVGLEWMHFHTKTTNAGTPDANQYMVSTGYVF
jgi:hypothetical protein